MLSCLGTLGERADTGLSRPSIFIRPPIGSTMPATFASIAAAESAVWPLPALPRLPRSALLEGVAQGMGAATSQHRGKGTGRQSAGDRKRPDLDALMVDLDAPERKALQALENAKGFLAERQGKS